MPLVSFSCLIALARTFCIVLNRSGENGHSCLVLALRGKAYSFSPLSMMLAVGLLYGVYHVDALFFSFYFVQRFYHEGVKNFIKHFFCIYWEDQAIFILYSVNLGYNINWFSCVEPPLHSRDKSHLVLIHDPFYILLN